MIGIDGQQMNQRARAIVDRADHPSRHSVRLSHEEDGGVAPGQRSMASRPSTSGNASWLFRFRISTRCGPSWSRNGRIWQLMWITRAKADEVGHRGTGRARGLERRHGFQARGRMIWILVIRAARRETLNCHASITRIVCQDRTRLEVSGAAGRDGE